MANKIGIDRFYFRGPRILCPDCDEPTVFLSGSVLGEVQNNHRIAPEVLERLYADCFKGTDILCLRCPSLNDTMFWVEQTPEHIIGPLCGECYHQFLVDDAGGARDIVDDVRLYVLKATTKNREVLLDLAEFFAREAIEAEEPRADESLGVLDLF